MTHRLTGWITWVLLGWLMGLPAAFAALSIDISGGEVTQIPVAVATFPGEEALPHPVSAIIRQDLARTGLIRLIDASGVVARASEPPAFDLWRGRTADAVAVGEIRPLPDGRMEVAFRLYDTVHRRQLAGMAYQVSPAQIRQTAHRIADEIYEKLTGERGAFSTRLVYVKKSGNRYSLQVSDADGYGPQTVYSSSEPIISPTFSPDGSHLAYVAFDQRKPIIFLQSLVTGHRQVLANFRGSNSAPAFSPDGRELAIVLTQDGASQIYLINRDGSNPRRLTGGLAINTEPAFSPDGKWVIFTSDQGGTPQIYRIPVSGGEPQRLTFEGSYNVSPQYSPDGKHIVFVQRQDGRFQITLRNLETGQQQSLTDTSADESPGFAPNGRMIVYATGRQGRGGLAVVSSDGRVRQALAAEGGDIRDPAWGPALSN